MGILARVVEALHGFSELADITVRVPQVAVVPALYPVDRL